MYGNRITVSKGAWETFNNCMNTAALGAGYRVANTGNRFAKISKSFRCGYNLAAVGRLVAKHDNMLSMNEKRNFNSLKGALFSQKHN